MMIGIYKVISPSGKVYIGQSVDVNRRLKRYKNMSVSTKKQTKLWRSLVKYGSNKHKYVLIEECEESKLNERERYYQELYDSVENGLNCNYTRTKDKSGRVSKETLKRMSEVQKGNKNMLGFKHTEETKDKIRKKALGRKFTDEQNKRKGKKGITPPLKGKFGAENPISKKIGQYSKNGELIKVWDSAMDVKRELGFSNSNICSCCKGNLKTSSGYVWRYI